MLWMLLVIVSQVLAERKQEQTRTSRLLEMIQEVSGKLEEIKGWGYDMLLR